MRASGPSGLSLTLWRATAPTAAPPPLTEDLHVQACIVGAGIVGLTTAYLLAKEGYSVAVLDHGPIGGGQSERTTAHLSNAIDDRYVEIERIHGLDKSRLVAASHTAAIGEIERIAQEERIACDFERVDGYLFSAIGDDGVALEQERDAAERAGLAVRWFDRAPISSFETGPCLRFPDQAQFHPLRYLDGLAAAALRAGARLYSGTHVSEIDESMPAVVRTGRGATVIADNVIVATNVPVNTRLSIHPKQAPYTTYVVAGPIPRGTVAHALYWDTLDPYHYLRVVPANGDREEVLVAGGEDHRTGTESDPAARFGCLEQWVRELVPQMGSVHWRWSGQVMETGDGLAFIGRKSEDRPHVYLATGDSGMGLTHGTIAGMLLRDLVFGRPNPWAEVYDPSRRPIGALTNFLREDLSMAAQYLDWVTPGQVSSAEDVQPDSGAIVRRGLDKVAIYRDADGQVHERSAVCPHLGCLVRWNGYEKTWDCPCHGSRFDRYGKVLNGPSPVDLRPLYDEKAE
jgi:glycine/D-amino acid oxidase-like deaminating enzyme/nitrite reductase/ring-hydroxylating ferredoxin subunit